MNMTIFFIISAILLSTPVIVGIQSKEPSLMNLNFMCSISIIIVTFLLM